MVEKKELVRLIRTPEGEIRLDISGKANGRGAYLCKKLSCFETAVSRRGLERALKAKISKEAYERVREELLK